MIKQGIVKEELSIDSHLRKENGSCPLMPEEVFIFASFRNHFIVGHTYYTSEFLFILTIMGFIYFCMSLNSLKFQILSWLLHCHIII